MIMLPRLQARTVRQLVVVSATVLCMQLETGHAGEALLVGSIGGNSNIISVFSFAGTGWVKRAVAANVRWFDCRDTGAFVMHQSNLWYTGQVAAPTRVRALETHLIPADAEVAISPDGQRLAWTESRRTVASLFVASAETGRTNLLLSVSTNGHMSNVSWSPDSLTVAYYYGPPEAMVEDGYLVMTLDVSATNVVPIRVTPPSLRTRPSPARGQPPEWSPDGGFMLIEARYSRDETQGIRDSGMHYVVRSDGGQLFSVGTSQWAGTGHELLHLVGTWSSGDHVLYNLPREPETERPATRVVRRMRILRDGLEVGETVAELANDFYVLNLCRQGTWGVIARDGVMAVVDTTTGREWGLDSMHSTLMQWVSIDEKEQEDGSSVVR